MRATTENTANGDIIRASLKGITLDKMSFFNKSTKETLERRKSEADRTLANLKRQETLIEEYKQKWADTLESLKTLMSEMAKKPENQEIHDTLAVLQQELLGLPCTPENVDATDAVVKFIARAYQFSEFVKSPNHGLSLEDTRTQLLAELQSLAFIVRDKEDTWYKVFGLLVIVSALLLGAAAVFTLVPSLAVMLLGVSTATKLIGILSISAAPVVAMIGVCLCSIGFESGIGKVANAANAVVATLPILNPALNTEVNPASSAGDDTMNESGEKGQPLLEIIGGAVDSADHNTTPAPIAMDL